MIILHIRNSVIQFKNHGVVHHGLVTVYIKIAVEWCLYLVAGDIEFIWHYKCVCNTIFLLINSYFIVLSLIIFPRIHLA